MLIKSLGALDIVAGLAIIIASIITIPSVVLLVFGGVLISKSFLGMLKEIGGWIDLIVGGALISSIIVDIPLFIAVILGILVIQKGVMSFL